MTKRRLFSFSNPIFRLLLSFVVYAIFQHQGFAQSNNIGNPPIKNFQKKEYHGGTQNWQISQNDNGVVYAANNQGLLEFNGNHWRLYPLPNGTIMRSFAIDKNDRIYVGGQGEMGYFEGNEKGVLTYHSLTELLPKEHQIFSDVWEILIDKDDVYFMAYQMVAKWDNGEMKVFLANEGYLFLDKIGDRFYLQKGDGTFGYTENHLIAPFRELFDFEVQITTMFATHPDSAHIFTEDGEMYQLYDLNISHRPVPEEPFFKNNTIYCSDILPNGQLVLGSTSAGIAILDKDWKILQKINKANDLQNNTVLSVFASENGNLWLGLDNGITFVQANSALNEFFPDGDLEGTCYSSVIHKDLLYTATNTGIYSISWKPYYLPEEKTDFQKVANSSGQVWSLGKHRGMLLAGHSRGAFVVDGNETKQVSDLTGVWRFLPVGDKYLIAGHYGGLGLFEQQSNTLNYLGVLDGLIESYRLLAYDNGQVWMAHPYRGIFRNKLSLENRTYETTHYDSNNGLPANYNNHLFQINDQIVFTGDQGVYMYDIAKDTFLPDESFNKIFGKDTKVKYLRQDKKGNIWYAAGNEAGVLWIKDLGIEKRIEKMVIPELTDKLHKEFEHILPIDDRNVLFTTEKGVTHFDPGKYNVLPTPPKIVLSEVWLKGKQDSLLFGGYFQNGIQTVIPKLSHQQNALEFIFSSTDHEGQEFIKYSHKLEDTEDDWSAWEGNTILSINNLRPGNYTLFLKAKNKLNTESTPIQFSFEISPPWYASTLAYSFYGVLLIGAFIGLAFFQNKKYKKEKELLHNTYLEEQEKKEFLVQQSKQKINLLEKQQLETEVKFKNQELAAATMNLLQKSEMLTSIEVSLEKMKKSDDKKEEVYSEINRLLKLVKKENNLSDEWERFSKHFDSVHSDFLKRLGEKYPNLSPNDYKLSAYLKMNLSTKEIASLMNISIRGVEASRYRLRKRLELDTVVNLTDFLMKL